MWGNTWNLQLGKCWQTKGRTCCLGSIYWSGSTWEFFLMAATISMPSSYTVYGYILDKSSPAIFIKKIILKMLTSANYFPFCLGYNVLKESLRWYAYLESFLMEDKVQRVALNTLRPKQNGCHFPVDIFKCIFLNENVWISLKFVPKVRINNIPALVQIMDWHRPGDKPLSEPKVVSLPTRMRHSAWMG